MESKNRWRDFTIFQQINRDRLSDSWQNHTHPHAPYQIRCSLYSERKRKKEKKYIHSVPSPRLAERLYLPRQPWRDDSGLNVHASTKGLPSSIPPLLDSILSHHDIRIPRKSITFFYPFLIGFTKKRNGRRGAGNPGVSFATIENPIHRNELFGMGIVIRLRHILESSRNFA